MMVEKAKQREEILDNYKRCCGECEKCICNNKIEGTENTACDILRGYTYRIENSIIEILARV